MTDDAGPDNCPDCLEVSLDRDDTGYALCERHALAEAVSGWNCDLCGDCACHEEALKACSEDRWGMTDARNEEAAARAAMFERIRYVDGVGAARRPTPTECVDAYRDAIEKRVRGECDAEAVAAERARWEAVVTPALLGGQIDRAKAALHPFEEHTDD